MFTFNKSVQILKNHISIFPPTLVILGSGWNNILKDIIIESEIGYETLFGVKTTVPGHTGKLIVGKIDNKRVAFMSGRIHMYEGYSGEEATLPIRVFANAEIKNIIITAACGALNPKYNVGDFVILSDMITLFLVLDNPLKGPQFVDVSQVFDTEMRKRAKEICTAAKIPFREGVYVYYHGPNYETPADKMALRLLGADVCGMSTVPETLTARSLGIKVLGLSFVTNLAFVKHDHKQVIAEANRGSRKMKIILLKLLDEKKY